MIRILRLAFHVIGVILSIILLCIDDPGYDSAWIWMIGALILHAVLIIPIFTEKGDN